MQSDPSGRKLAFHIGLGVSERVHRREAPPYSTSGLLLLLAWKPVWIHARLSRCVGRLEQRHVAIDAA